MRELVHLGVQVHAAMPPGGSLIDSYAESDVTVHPMQFDFPIRHPYRCTRTFRKFRKLVREVKPDIIHSHFVGTTLTMRLALGKNHPLPRIFQVPGPLHLEHWLFGKIETAISGTNDYWVASCQWTLNYYRDQLGISKDRTFLSYYGVDIENFSPRIHGKLRTELGLNAETELVGIVAYMYPPKKYLGQTRGLKGHEDLIDALAFCRRKGRDVKGVFIGGGWNNAYNYEARVKSYGKARCGDNIYFLGTRNDVPDLYPDLNLVVHPSHSENVGGAVESLLLNVPTITTNVGGFTDLIINNETGYLVPPKNPQKLAEKIIAALKNPKKIKQMAQNGRALARDLLDVKKNSRNIYNIYHHILN
jgi:glycosyltransferase involved in cell wall biosynthesis